jgi:hypothetical protein
MGAGEELDGGNTDMNRYRNFVERCSQALVLVGFALMFALMSQRGFRAITVEKTISWKSSEPGIHQEWKIDIRNPLETISSMEGGI